jgi:hypothetical protein
MMTAAAVLVCALNLIGRPMPPIVLLDVRPADTSPTVEAFVRRNTNTIYLMTTSRVFEDARRYEFSALRKIASILVHEEWHLRHGPDERAAYQAQLMELMRLGESPGRPVYTSVVRSMMAVLKAQRQPEIVVAGVPHR